MPISLFRHDDNNIFFDYIDSNLKIENSLKDEEKKEGLTSLKVLQSEGKEASDLAVKVGDDIRLGESFKSRVTDIKKGDKILVLHINHAYKGEEKKEDTGDKMEEGSKEEPDTEIAHEVSVLVKRENSRMEDPHAISIAFNLARLHEQKWFVSYTHITKWCSALHQLW